MRLSESPEKERVARYFDVHAEDFDSIYEQDKGTLRRIRDRLSRGTVVRRLDFVLDYASRRKPRSVIDVGCGAGRFAVPLAVGGASVTGLDFADEMVLLAERRAEAAGVGDRCRFLRADFLEWKTDERFDLALAMGVFDYVSDPGPLLAKMAEVTDGSVLASFPRRFHPLVPLRKIRLGRAGVPVFFYTRRDVETLAGPHLPRFEVRRFGRDFLLAGEPG